MWFSVLIDCNSFQLRFCQLCQTQWHKLSTLWNSVENDEFWRWRAVIYPLWHHWWRVWCSAQWLVKKIQIHLSQLCLSLLCFSTWLLVGEISRKLKEKNDNRFKRHKYVKILSEIIHASSTFVRRKYSEHKEFRSWLLGLRVNVGICSAIVGVTEEVEWWQCFVVTELCSLY